MTTYLERIYKKKVLITGGLGFIGHNLAKKLADSYQCEVTIVDNCLNSSPAAIKDIKTKVEHLNFSVLENEKLFPILEKVNYIFHLACIQINHSGKDPFLDLEVNAKSTLNILEYIRHHRPSQLERFIYTSTTSIYGSSIKLPLEEGDSPNILNHYAASKYLAENYTNLYNLQYDLPTTVVRYSNVYGFGQTPKNPYCGVLGKFIHNALTNQPLNVYGDGEQTRDYTFIDDAVKATIIAAVHPRAFGDIFNIGTGVETSVNTLVSLISEIIPGISVSCLPERDIDNIRRRAISLGKIHQRLGWLPETNIKKGLQQTLNWYKTTLAKND